MEDNQVLTVENLRTYFFLDEGVLKAVDGVSFQIGKSETLGVIGESGCGKSVTAQSILRIVPTPGKTVHGSAVLHRDGRDAIDLTKLKPSSDTVRDIRGREISMIFQEPMTSLSPVHRIGDQIMEALLIHKTDSKEEAKEITMDLLNKVGVPDPAQRIGYYPYQLSGGLRQRVMIAIALSCNPALLIADEPTTALDVTVQAQILELMENLQSQYHMSILYITHDLGVIAEISDRVAVMYLGRIVEEGTADQIFYNPLHPYTERLLKSIPRIGKKARTMLDAIEGTVPIPLNMPWQCGYHSRCHRALAGRCSDSVPALGAAEEGHLVRCFLHADDEEQADG